MVCREDNCLFVHVPKTAGQSIERFFLKRAGLSWNERGAFLMKYNPDPELGPDRLAHLTALEYVKCGHVSQSDFDRLYKFSFVRNPWDRLVSEYQYRGHDARFSFKDFVFKHFPEPGLNDHYRHVMQQYKYLVDTDGNLLVDYLGKFESLQCDFNAVCKNMGIRRSRLPHKNASSRKKSTILFRRASSLWVNKKKKYIEYYDEETAEYVGKIYEKDIEMFGYNFGE